LKPDARHKEDRVHCRSVRPTWIVEAHQMHRPHRQQRLDLRPQIIRQAPTVIANSTSGSLHFTPLCFAMPRIWTGPDVLPTRICSKLQQERKGVHQSGETHSSQARLGVHTRIVCAKVRPIALSSAGSDALQRRAVKAQTVEKVAANLCACLEPLLMRERQTAVPTTRAKRQTPEESPARKPKHRIWAIMITA
jgi:hypothetical protein